MIELSASTLVAIAALITAVVGVFAYKSNKKVAANKDKIDGAATAITGLDVLAKQHTQEIRRISTNHEEAVSRHDAYALQCELDKRDFAQTISKHEGQISVLQSIPLVNIDTTLQRLGEFDEKMATNISSLADTSNKILVTLETSAKKLVTDTLDAAEAVQQVKTDLHKDDKNVVRKVKNGE